MDHPGAGAEDAMPPLVVRWVVSAMCSPRCALTSCKAASKKTANAVTQEEDAAKVDELQSQLDSIGADIQNGKLPKAPYHVVPALPLLLQLRPAPST